MPLVVSPDPEFTSQLAELEAGSKAAADAALLLGQRKWMYPPLNSWNGNPFDIKGMNSAFDRSNLNATYVQVVSDMQGRGTVGEAMALKMQIDYIAALERAFRTRYCSSVRARIHAAARRRGQGDTNNGLFTARLQMSIMRLLESAHDSSEQALAEDM